MAKRKQKSKRLTTLMKGKLSGIFFIIVCFFLVLIVRLGYWNIIKGDEFSTKVLENQESSSTIIPYERGKIYDRNGNILATNEKKYTLILEPKNILSSDGKYLDHTIDILNQYLGLDKEELKSYINEHENSYYEIYKKDLTYKEVCDLQDFLALSTKSASEEEDEKTKKNIESAQSVKGIVFEESYERIYPYDSLACRALGFTVSGNVGTWGIEQYYNDELNGVDGREYSYLNQELVTEKTVIEAQNGNSVVSTIDMEIQKIVEDQIEVFDQKIGSSNTSVLVMNPQNGEILAMASSNPFDLNDPMNEEELKSLYTQEEILEMKEYTEKLENAEDSEAAEEEGKITIYDAFSKLQRNPIVSDANEPGSTYKPFTVAAGLESGVLTGEENFYCTGSLKVADRQIGCSHVHGSLTLKDALAQSCNVAMMNAAFKEGAETFYAYQSVFGFGQKTGIDLPGEANTSRLVYNATNYDNDATLATNSFGQNFNCTMVQMAAAFGSLINGGRYYKPHVVKEILSGDGNISQETENDVTRLTISEETSDIISKYLEETVSSGTAKLAAIPGYSIGGKTGTAEKIPRNKKDYYVSFIAYTPLEDPELLIYVTIDEPNLEQQATASIAVELERRCMTQILEVAGVDPDDKEAYENAKANGTLELSMEPYSDHQKYVEKDEKESDTATTEEDEDSEDKKQEESSEEKADGSVTEDSGEDQDSEADAGSDGTVNAGENN